jgi:nitrite reductase/ring-hydroxylating ferredoxin subunit
MREAKRDPEVRGRTVRIPDTGLLPEKVARKVLVEDPRGGPAREVVLARLDGRLYALDSVCPHEGGRISAGPLWEERYVVCPLHLCKFDPRDGRAVEVEWCGNARTYPVRELDGVAELWIPEPD